MTNDKDFINIRCRAVRELFLELLDGTLSDARRRSVEEHLQTCAPCREKFEQIQPAHHFLASELPDAADSVSVPPYLAMRIKHKLSHTDDQVWWRRRAGKGAYAAAAAVLVAAVGTSIILTKNNPAPSPQQHELANQNNPDPYTFFIVTGDDAKMATGADANAEPSERDVPNQRQSAGQLDQAEARQLRSLRYQQMQQTPRVHSPVLMVQHASFDREM